LKFVLIPFNNQKTDVMKKIAIYALTCCLSLIGSQLFAQAQTACNNKTAPEVQSGFYSVSEIGATIWTPAPPMAVQAVGLPNVEYLVVKKTCALDSARTACEQTAGGGWVILGSDADGIFDPATISRYGVSITAGDTFGVVAVGYDLTQVKGLLNRILTGTITGTTNGCCALFELDATTRGFCDTLGTLGIDSQDDVNNLTDVLTVFDAFTDAQLSVPGLLEYMGLVNGYAGLLSNAGCGTTVDGVILCYGMNPNAIYWYKAANNVAVEQFSPVAELAMYPNPTSGDVTLQLSTEKATDVSVNIYNALGVKVSSENLGLIEGTYTYNAATAGFAAGMYIVEITDGKNSQTQKLTVR
jgi:hypothetical protein